MKKKPQRMTSEQLGGVRLSLSALLTVNAKGNRNLFAYFVSESTRLALHVPQLLEHIDALEAELMPAHRGGLEKAVLRERQRCAAIAARFARHADERGDNGSNAGLIEQAILAPVHGTKMPKAAQPKG